MKATGPSAGSPAGRTIEFPREVVFFAGPPIGSPCSTTRKLGKYVVRMLMVDERLTMIGFARLEELGKSWMRRGQRLGRKHFAKQNAAAAKVVLLHQHQPVHRLDFALAARAALLVVIHKHDAVCHQIPGADRLHPHIFRRHRRLPSCARTGVRRGHPIRLGLRHIHAGHVHAGHILHVCLLFRRRVYRGDNAEQFLMRANKGSRQNNYKETKDQHPHVMLLIEIGLGNIMLDRLSRGGRSDSQRRYTRRVRTENHEFLRPVERAFRERRREVESNSSYLMPRRRVIGNLNYRCVMAGQATLVAYGRRRQGMGRRYRATGAPMRMATHWALTGRWRCHWPGRRGGRKVRFSANIRRRRHREGCDQQKSKNSRSYLHALKPERHYRES
jgi:hypothetical protein